MENKQPLYRVYYWTGFRDGSVYVPFSQQKVQEIQSEINNFLKENDLEPLIENKWEAFEYITDHFDIDYIQYVPEDDVVESNGAMKILYVDLEDIKYE